MFSIIVYIRDSTFFFSGEIVNASSTAFAIQTQSYWSTRKITGPGLR